MRSQSSLELLVTLAFGLLILLPVLILALLQITTSSASLSVSIAQSTASKLSSIATAIGSQGYPARQTVLIQVPPDVHSIYVGTQNNLIGHEITFIVKTSIGLSYVTAYTPVNVSGYLEQLTQPGTYLVNVSAMSSCITDPGQPCVYVSAMSFVSASTASAATTSIGYSAPASIPAGIVHYVPILLTNTRTSAFPANSQIMMPVNSVAYRSYEAGDLSNIEFFYSNGTVVPYWLEGSASNSLLNTASNTLYLSTSANTIYWVRIASSSAFMCSHCSNTIYLGFASTSTNLFDGLSTGEAPQLSGTYGQYDDGASVFSYYNDFANSESLSGFSLNQYLGASASNGLTVTSPYYVDDIGAVYTGTSYHNMNFVYDAYGEAQQVGYGSIFLGTSVQANNGGVTTGDFGLWLWGTFSSGAQNWEVYSDGDVNAGSVPLPNMNQFYVLTTGATTSSGFYSINYGAPMYAMAYGSSGINPVYVGFHIDSNAKEFYYWMRTRIYPPSGSMPRLQFGVPV